MKKNNVSELPVIAFEDAILGAVAGSAVTIVTAETGAGKSTQVPQMLASAGYRVIVTQPRRLAARTLAQRVAQEMNTRLGDRVGCRTAEERSDSAATEILFVTDGLQLVRELAGQGGTGRKTVLVLDEVHEWNLNVEVLVAWVKSRQDKGDDLKCVLMSATIDAERLASFYNGAPVISVPGRLFPVEKKSASARDLVAEAVSLAKQGRNVLVFQPGKREITDTVGQIEHELGEKALVLPLHGELEPSEQQRCFAPPPAGKVKVIVSTNVAQTSVTIPDVDAVVDSGIERRVELADGIEGLYLKPISQADCLQRAGRAGRTKAGVYVLCSETGMTDRQPYPTAEIMRSRLDQMVLRLAVQGFDATKLEFFHQPDKDTLVDARRALVALGAMSGEGNVTQIGRRMARFSVSCEYARMLIEAERHGVVEQVATIAGCLEAGDIRVKAASKYEEPAWKKLTQESKSDLLATLDVFEKGKEIKGRNGQSKAEALREAGIFARDFFRADELRRKLLDATRGEVRSDSKKFASKEEERQAILKACVAGMVDHLYRSQYGWYKNGSPVERELARESVVRDQPEWLVGLPKDIEITTRRGKMTLHLVSMATAVDPTWLADVAPQLVEKKTGLRPCFDPAKDSVVSTTETFFNGQKIKAEAVADPEHPEATNIFCAWLAGQPQYEQKEARALNTRAGETIFTVMNRDEVERWLKERLEGARRMSEVKNLTAIALPELEQGMIDLVVGENPDEIVVLGKSLAVEYRDGYTPRVTLDRETISAHGWRELPDAGVKLPGGRLVEVVVSFGYYDTVSGQNIPELKSRCVSKANKSLWDNWPTEGRPAIALPDPADPASVVPEIVTAQYGTSVVDGTPLVAYGVAALRGYRYSSDPWFEGKWLQLREEAEKARAEAAVKLESVREEALKQKWLDDARKAAEAAKESLRSVQSREGWRDLEFDLRSRVDNRLYGYLPSSTEDLRGWMERTAALMAEVDAAFKAKADAKAAEEARIAAAEKSGHLVRTLEVICDTRHGRGHVWVIRPDGTVREHDGYGSGGQRRYGSYVWHMISEELVIVHNATVTGAEFSGTGIAWRPMEVTQAQIATVERLEVENGLAGTFEVDPALVAKRARMMEEIRKEILRVAPEEDVQELMFLNVSRPDGHHLRQDPRRLVNWANPFSARCEGRDAQITKAVRCADGMLEFLAYEKWGGTNLNVRWRPLTDEEKAAAPQPAPAPKPARPVLKPEELKAATEADLNAFAAKFGKKGRR